METRMKGFMENCWWFNYILNLDFMLKFVNILKGREDPVDLYKIKMEKW